ncbi:hypothetical protein [Streptomyces sp. NPDC048489]|uniref:hypothetical protein n=1 Tax=Streptomyces sp. NPDC048489 TaxID=3154504 RepID=UPI0034449DBA
MSSSQTTEPEQPDEEEQEEKDQPLTLDVLRHLVRKDWARLPGKTLVVLSRDTEGNGFSPFCGYTHSRYSPVYELTGETYPLESELAKDRELRDLYPEIPDDAVAALVLYPLG